LTPHPISQKNLERETPPTAGGAFPQSPIPNITKPYPSPPIVRKRSTLIDFNPNKSVKNKNDPRSTKPKNKKMPVIKYSQTPITISYDGDVYVTANSASVSYAAPLEASRILAPNQNNNFRIGGPLATRISFNFVACNKTSYNAANLLLTTLVGDTPVQTIKVGASEFYDCFCTSASVDISPFAPVNISAEFVSNNMPVDVPFSPETGPALTEDLTGYLAHGYNTVIVNGDALSDQNYESISYKVNCSRTPTFVLGQSLASNMFLDAVEKELNIKATNIGNFINYSGYGDIIDIDVRNDLGNSIFVSPLSMSSNSRILSQNLSMSENSILAGDISLREVIL
jgi:hypothetical protein